MFRHILTSAMAFLAGQSLPAISKPTAIKNVAPSILESDQAVQVREGPGRRTLYTYWYGARGLHAWWQRPRADRLRHHPPTANRAREKARNLRNMEKAKFRAEVRQALRAAKAQDELAAISQELGMYEAPHAA